MATPGNREEVVERFEALIRRFPDEPWLYYYLASTEWTSRTPRVPKHYSRAADLLQRRGDFDGEMDARRGRSTFLLDIGDAAESSAELERMKALVGPETSPENRAWVDIVEARFLVIADKSLDRAVDVLRRSEAYVRDSGTVDINLKRRWLNQAFTATYELGRYDEAKPLLDELVTASETAGSAQGRATAALFQTLFAITTNLPTSAVREAAVTNAERSLELSQAAGVAPLEARSLRLLGQLRGGDEGRRHFARCLELTRDSAGLARLRVDCLSALAVSEARDGDPNAWSRIVEAQQVVEGLDDDWPRLTLERAAARVLWLQGHRERGWNAGLKILDRLEELRDAQSGDSGRVGVLAARWEPYLWLAGELLAGRSETDRIELERAFQVIERMRGRVLLDSLAESRSERPQEPASLASVERELEEHEAMLSFQFSVERDVFGRSVGGSWVIVSTHDGSRAIRLEDRLKVEPPIGDLVRLKRLDEAPEVLQLLHGQLLAKALATLPAAVEHLILVLDGELHRIPFEALRASPDPSASLVNRFRISYQPSATLWLKWRTLPVEMKPPLSVLALADPMLPVSDPVPGLKGLRGRPDCRDLPPLLHAREEGRQVLKSLGMGRLWIGVDASEAALKAEPLSEHSLIHFAAHACTLPSRPEASAILLAAGDAQQDGHLRPADILELDNLPPMIVLAACRTADGRVVRGEGVMSLVRSFFEAGARVVVASQRDLPDYESSLIFSAVYRHLSEGLSVGEALQRVQRERIRAGAPSAGWGSLRVLGDADWVPFPGGISVPRESGHLEWILAIALALLAVGALVVLWRQRRARDR
ncbi:MAG: CHAT domain-containing protein [Acidobacteriota bacterium]